MRARRLFPWFVAIVTLVISAMLLLSAVQGQQKIPGVGYTPPAGAMVHHCDTSPQNLTARCGGSTTPLNAAIPWDGTNTDPGYVGRYMDGRATCAASWICGVGNENECLRASQILREMFQRGELGDRTRFTGEPTRRECHDFGAQHPELGSVVGGTGGLRPQPSNPSGCCRSSLPCVVDDPRRKVGETWQEAVLTPQGGRRGCFMIRPARAPNPDPPPPPPPPVDTPSPPVDTPSPPVKCWLLRIAGSDVSLEQVTCP